LATGFFTLAFAQPAGAAEPPVAATSSTSLAWQRQTVSAAAPGWYSSLVMDGQGRPHIAYRETSTALKYAYYDGTSWRGEKDAAAPDTISWTGSGTMTLGYVVSMALDNSGRPHIAFATDKLTSGTSTEPYKVRYASWDGSDWQVSEVQSNSSYRTGVYVSLAIDGTTPHLSYIDCTTSGDSRSCSGRLMYATHDGSNWVPTEVSSGAGVSGYTSLALDGSTPHIAYYQGAVYYASPGTPWTSQYVASGSKELSLAIYDHVPRIAFNSGNGYAVLNAGLWTFPLPQTSIGGQPSLAIDAAGHPHVAYRGYAFGTTAIIHRWFNGVAWQSEPAGELARTATPPELAAWYPSLALDGAGHARVSYFVQTNTPAYGDGPTVYAHLNQVSATGDTATVRQDATVTVDVLANDTQLGFSGKLDLSVTTQPVHGTVTVSPDGTKLVYDPADDYSGPDSLLYQVCDANGTPVLCTTATVSLTVQPVLHVTANKAIDYGQDPWPITPEYTGFLPGDDAGMLTVAPTCTLDQGAPYTATGSPYGITCAGGVDETYAFEYTPGELTVAKATLTVTANAAITYGEVPGPITPTYTGFVGDDTAAMLDVQPVCAVEQGPPYYAGVSYPTVCTGGVDDNYTFTYQPGTLTVGKAALQVTANAAITYGEPVPELKPAYTGFVGADGPGVLDSPATCVVDQPGPYQAGVVYPISCFGWDDNYDVQPVPGYLTVDKALLTVTADNQSKTYGDPNPDLTFHYDGFVPGDGTSAVGTPPTCTTDATQYSPVTGVPYLIECSGGAAANYTLRYEPGQLTVLPAPLGVTAEKSITYGQEASDVVPAYTGFRGDDGPGDLTTAPTCTVDSVGPYTAAGSPYGITCSGGVDENYALSYTPGKLTVGKATLTVTADDQSKAYGEPNQALTFAYSGFVFGDGPGVLDVAPTCTTTATQYSPVGGSPYGITCSGGSDDNYAFAYVGAKLTIAPAEALVNYVGETMFVSSGSTSSTVQATLTATLQAVDEDYPLGTGTVDFVDLATGKVLAANVTVMPVPGQPNVGTANVITTLSTGQYGAESYLIQVVATGNYTNGAQPDEDKTAVVVAAKPATTNQTTGGGTLDPLAPAGTYAGDPARDVTFSIGITYNKTGTNLQGKIVLAIPQMDGSVVYVKSNALSSMKVDKDKTTSTIYAKSSVYRIADGVVTSIDGNVSLRVDVVEGQGTMALAGFTVLSSKDSTLYYSNQWVRSGTVWATVVQPLRSGFGIEIK
jgi:hypothetical protein